MIIKEPGPLLFPDEPKKPQVKQPGALSFDNVPTPPVVKTRAPEPDRTSHVGALTLPSTPVTKPKPVVPGAMFDNTPSVVEQQAATSAKTRFANLSQKQIESVERQIQQLLPLNLTNISKWAEVPLNEQAAQTLECAKLTREYSQTNGSELIEKTLQSSKPATGFKRLLSSHESPIDFKPALIVLKQTISCLLPRCDQLLAESKHTKDRLSLNMVALSSVLDVAGKCPDTAIEDAINQRTQLLHQATNQITLTCSHVEQLRTQIADLDARVTQMLTVTIPALELAAAGK